MIRPLVTCLALLAAPVAAEAQGAALPHELGPELSLEHRMLLRCSAAFALVADRQQRGEQWALAYEPMQQRGLDFFVIATNRVQQEAQLEDWQLEASLRAEAQSLLDQQSLGELMPVCLTLLPEQ